jgi:hypothetical protein
MRRLAVPVTILILLVIALFYLELNPTAFVVREETEEEVLPAPEPAVQEPEEKIIDMKPDFIDKNLGTVVFWTNRDFSDEQEGIVEFFASKKIPGLNIRYRIADRRITGGLPMLVSAEENHFDGRKHMIGYSFERGKGQALVFDGRVVAQGPFTGIPEKATIGMAIGYPPEEAEPDAVKLYTRVLDIDELKQLYQKE